MTSIDNDSQARTTRLSNKVNTVNNEHSIRANFFGLNISLYNKHTLTEIICTRAKNGRSFVVIAINPQYVNEAVVNDEFRISLQTADLLYVDGVGVLWALRIHGYAVPERAATTDLLPLICSVASVRGLRLFFLGGQPGVAEEAAENLQIAYPGLSVVGAEDGYFDSTEETRMVKTINDSHPDILFVGMGVPKEQLWVIRNKHLIEAGVIMTCGGLFDYYSGRIKRAPSWMHGLGFEWLYRVLRHPRQYWKRYLLGNPIYVYRTIGHFIRSGGAI